MLPGEQSTLLGWGPVSDQSRTLAGVLLIAIVTIEFGGSFALRIARGQEAATDLQRRFSRAGHGHAGVFVILALVSQLYVDVADLSGPAEGLARYGVAWGAILLPAGFFLSVIGPGRTEPNRLVVLLWLGAASVAAGVLTLGIGLLAA